MKWIAIGIACLGILIALCKCCAKTCAEDDTPVVYPTVTANPGTVDNRDLDNENLDQANMDENVYEQQNVPYSDAPSYPSAPPADFSYAYKYDVATNEVSEMPAMPPPSYEDVVSSDVATE